jgi:sigma-B regulation protein RsbU (phosphoserine phosphatase)
MLHETPDAILDDLNSALHMETVESMQTCTAVYGQIDMSRDAATVILAVAGHPAPLVVRAGGGVETTPARGTLLGAVRHPVFQTCAVDLGPGDAIVVYSDGLLDTRIDGADVDERCLAEILTGTARASAAQLVDRLRDSVRRIDRPLRDDVAFMALRRTPSA